MDFASVVAHVVPPAYQPLALSLFGGAYAVTWAMAFFQPTKGVAAAIRPVLNVVAGNLFKAALPKAEAIVPVPPAA